MLYPPTVYLRTAEHASIPAPRLTREAPYLTCEAPYLTCEAPYLTCEAPYLTCEVGRGMQTNSTPAKASDRISQTTQGRQTKSGAFCSGGKYR
jgi:hypothetical protein